MGATDTMLVVLLLAATAMSANMALVTDRWPWHWPIRFMALVYSALAFMWALAAVASFNEFAPSEYMRPPVLATGALIWLLAMGGSAVADHVIRRSGDDRFARNADPFDMDDIGPEDLVDALHDWSLTVHEVESGYTLTADAYLDDLEARSLLGDFEQQLTTAQAEDLAALDGRFRAATRDMSEGERFITGADPAAHEWWYARLPLKLTGAASTSPEDPDH